jgi:DNA-directed RNA polymerase specialized sigma subunit
MKHDHAPAEEIHQLMDDLAEKIIMFADRSKEAMEKIEMLTNVNEKAVLYARYINGHTFRSIAEDMGCKQRKIYQLHSSGLIALEGVMKNESEHRSN